MSKAKEIAEERFARGEISKEQLNEMLQELREPDLASQEVEGQQEVASKSSSIKQYLIGWLVFANVMTFFFYKNMYCMFVYDDAYDGPIYLLYALLIQIPGFPGMFIGAIIFGDSAYCG